MKTSPTPSFPNLTWRGHKAAFTLVEILVVLALLSLLAVLLLAVFSRVRENGRRIVCASNQKQILLALQLYENDSAGSFPYDGDFIDSGWINRMLPYVADPQIFLCPTDGDVEEKTSRGFVTSLAGVKNAEVPSSYIVNKTLLSSGMGYRDKRKLMASQGRLAATVVQPASTVFMTDGAEQAFPEAPYWISNDETECSVEGGAEGYFLSEPSQSHFIPVVSDTVYADCFAPSPRHLGRANVGFVDGHVKSLDVAQWYFPHTPYLDPTRGG